MEFGDFGSAIGNYPFAEHRRNCLMGGRSMEGDLLISDLTSRIDEEGFLIEGEEWNREIAEFLAAKQTPNGLSEDQWQIINYLRDYYLNYGSVPAPKMLCRATGFTFKRLSDLFPSGLVEGAYRVAGIPRVIADPTCGYP